MIKADALMAAFFTRELTARGLPERDYSGRFWWPYRQQVVKQQPALKHDVTNVRRVTYGFALKSLGLDEPESHALAEQALAYFLKVRSDFSVAPETLAFLEQLAGKYPLVAITNGNVDVERIGLAPFFKHVFMAGDGNLQKPDVDMFSQAFEQLSIAPSQLLHVGDCGRADIVGALRAGCQAAWLNKYKVGKPIKVLPHIELTDVEQLLLLP